MNTKFLHRALIAYTILIGLSIFLAILDAMAIIQLPNDPSGFRSISFFIWLFMELIFLKDLIYRRDLSPKKQYHWVLFFLLLNIIGFWLYDRKVLNRQPCPSPTKN